MDQGQEQQLEGLCSRFKEQREAKRWIGYFANLHEGEDTIAYRLFGAMMRIKMGLMILAPDREERFEPVYRDSLKYHLQTIRHGRLATSFAPLKTRVYFIETPGIIDAFYPCVNFCIPGGTLAGGDVDLVSPITANCPLILGPAMPESAFKRGLLEAGGVVAANTLEEVVELARAWITNPEDARAHAQRATEWLAKNPQLAGR